MPLSKMSLTRCSKRTATDFLKKKNLWICLTSSVHVYDKLLEQNKGKTNRVISSNSYLDLGTDGAQKTQHDLLGCLLVGVEQVAVSLLFNALGCVTCNTTNGKFPARGIYNENFMSADEITNLCLVLHSISKNILSHIINQRCSSAFYQQP
jgi:hypothetical protein